MQLKHLDDVYIALNSILNRLITGEQKSMFIYQLNILVSENIR